MTDVDAATKLVLEGDLFSKLMNVLPEALKGEADFLYQEGVPVADIAAQFGYALMDAAGPRPA